MPDVPDTPPVPGDAAACGELTAAGLRAANARLRDLLAGRDAQIGELQAQVAAQDARIGALQAQVADLAAQVKARGESLAEAEKQQAPQSTSPTVTPSTTGGTPPTQTKV